ncbi:MAG: VWA domain-containing protein [Chitinophagaceae bacterium]|nr:VWA domain-containing protein [Chitinophagaceae bacterium]
MKSRIALQTLFGIGLVCIIALSSFRREHNPESPSLNPPEIGYGATGKSSTSRGPLTLSSSFENDYYLNTQRIGHFYAEVKANEFLRNGWSPARVPLNLSLVIDRSGSMAGDKMRNAREAAKHVVDQMGPEDYLSIVIYDSQIDVLQPATRVMNRQQFKNIIDRIYDRGGTNLMGGAMKGYQEVQKNYDDSRINRVLLLSDGLANEGITNPREIDRIVQGKLRENGVSISTFGVGNDYNEDLMTAMAETGSGNYYFIGQPHDIAGIFQRELNGLKEVLAQRTELRIELPDELNVEKVYGYRYQQNGRILTVKFHDLFAGDTKGILIRYKVAPGMNRPLKISTSLSFYDAQSQRQERMSLMNRCEFTTDEYTYNRSFSEWVASQQALYESNERLEMAMKEVDKGNYQEARKLVNENKEYMKSKAVLVEKSEELKRAETTNAGYQSKIEDVESMPVEEVKVMQKATKSSNYQLRNKKR